MIKIIKDNTERKDFEGATTFANISNGLNNFALAIHKTIRTKYPKVFEMTEEEYDEVDEEIQIWLKTEEAYEINRQFQLESLSDIIIESISTMYNLKSNKKEITKKIIETLEKENVKEDKSQE